MDRKTKRWLAVYTKPRWEKKVDRGLEDADIERYCPLNRVRKKWSDRMKWVDEPLFKSYVFVHVNEEDEGVVRSVPGALNFVYWLGKPAIIKQADIDKIKRFLKEYDDVSAVPLELRANSRVIIKSGLLMDKEARVISSSRKKVEVEIDSMGYKLVAYIDKENVELLGKELKNKG